MRVTCVLLCLPLVVGIGYAEHAEQNDWSGGGGIDGPILNWSNQFADGSGIGYGGPGRVSLLGVPTSPVQHTIATGLSLPDAVYPVDIDGDGDTDVVGAFWSANAVYWFENINGNGTVWIQHTIDNTQNGPRDICAADIDDDGDLDVLGAIHAGNRLVWWDNINNGNSWTYHSIDGYLRSCSTVRAVDMDRDGDPDALATGVNVSGDLVVWWENDNAGATWIEHVITTAPFYPRGVHHADIDGDDDIDVIVAAWNDHEVSWWENPEGEGTVWYKHSVDAYFGGAYTVFCADIDGDGDSDVVAGAAQGNEIAWWDNISGDGTTWNKYTIDAASVSAHYVTVADIDYDGDADVLKASYGDNQLTWWGNNGDGSSWTEHVISNNCSGADMIRVGDLDGNGTLDAVAAAYLGGRIDWWEIVEFVDSGELTSSILDTDSPDVAWDTWDFDGTVPTGTTMTIEARAANDPRYMGAWVELQPGSLSDYLDDGLRYLQYRLAMNTSDTGLSPIVESIDFSWNLTTSTGSLPGMARMFNPYPNPSNAGINVHYTLAEPGHVELAVYDLAGRLVEVLISEAQVGGAHNVSWNGSRQAAGVYLLRLSAGGKVFTKRAVINQ